MLNFTAIDLTRDDPMFDWLTTTGALSAKLSLMCEKLTVQVVKQEFASADIDEQLELKITENNSLIREVYLCGDGIPWVFARTIVPYITYIKYKNELDNLGSKLLGESFLYKNNAIRKNLIYGKNNLDLRQRRSTFDLAGLNLLLTETFLAAIPKINHL